MRKEVVADTDSEAKEAVEETQEDSQQPVTYQWFVVVRHGKEEVITDAGDWSIGADDVLFTRLRRFALSEASIAFVIKRMKCSVTFNRQVKANC